MNSISPSGSQPIQPVAGDRKRMESARFVFSKYSNSGPFSLTRRRVRTFALCGFILIRHVPLESAIVWLDLFDYNELRPIVC